MIVSLVKFPQMPMSDHGQPKDWKMSQIMSEVPETKLPQQKSDNVRKNVDLNITKIGLYVKKEKHCFYLLVKISKFVVEFHFKKIFTMNLSHVIDNILIVK